MGAVHPAGVHSELRDSSATGIQRATLAMTDTQIEAVLRQGDTMLARNKIAAARAFYERAANANSAAAATIVAKTYDPIFLGRIGAVTVKAEPSLAAKWYQRAIELGDGEARVRLISLQVQANPHGR
jgi:TPR repeat protein